MHNCCVSKGSYFKKCPFFYPVCHQGTCNIQHKGKIVGLKSCRRWLRDKNELEKRKEGQLKWSFFINRRPMWIKERTRSVHSADKSLQVENWNSQLSFHPEYRVADGDSSSCTIKIHIITEFQWAASNEDQLGERARRGDVGINE